MSNRAFLEKHAQAGRVGLAGGATLSSRLIQRAERHLDPARGHSLWSHAFVFEGRRADGHHWVVESDLELHRKHIRLGVQENRIDKLCDEKSYCSLAVLDFGLTPEQVSLLIGEALHMVAGRVRYSLRELVGTLAGLRHPVLRDEENPLAREKSCFCSAFVQHIFRATGIDLVPGLDEKHTTPEDISRTPVPHTTFLLQRHARRAELGRKVRVGLRQLARKRARGVVVRVAPR